MRWHTWLNFKWLYIKCILIPMQHRTRTASTSFFWILYLISVLIALSMQFCPSQIHHVQVQRMTTMSNLSSQTLLKSMRGLSQNTSIIYHMHIMDYLSKSITDPTNKYLTHFWRILVDPFIVRFDSTQEPRLTWAF